jgi:hypothetical protein
MHDSANYKVIDRKKFAVIMVVLVSVVAVGAWLSLDYLAEYGEELQELAETKPLETAAIVTQLTRIVAILNGVLLSTLALLIVWHGLRGWRSEFMPPKGSWILEGQRTWSGEPAVRIAKFKIVVGMLLGVLAVASSLVLWDLSDTFADQTSESSHFRGHEILKAARCDVIHKSIDVA